MCSTAASASGEDAPEHQFGQLLGCVVHVLDAAHAGNGALNGIPVTVTAVTT
jgi:hypothetical protein